MGRSRFSWLWIGPNVGICEHGDEPSDSIEQYIF
jgi:hypothetical protein